MTVRHSFVPMRFKIPLNQFDGVQLLIGPKLFSVFIFPICRQSNPKDFYRRESLNQFDERFKYLISWDYSIQLVNAVIFSAGAKPSWIRP